ncbi:hypothetical protein AAC387_Pa07g1082 [Persea americana]
MVNPRRLVNMASKVAAIGRRRRIMLPRTGSSKNSTTIGKSRPEKGNFVVYTADGRRFAVPLSYLENPIFIELLKMSEEEFGLPGNGPIKLPCDGVFMDYVMSLVERCVCEEVEKALVISMGTGRCWYSSSLLQQEQANQQILVHGFRRSHLCSM